MSYVQSFSRATSRELNPMNSSLFIWPTTWYCAMFLSLHSHVLRHSVFSSRPKQTKPQHLEVFFSNSVVALRISSRLSPWRFQVRIPVLSSAGEARTASVLMPPTRQTRRLAAGEPVKIPADLVLDSLFVKDFRTLCNQLSLPATGTRSVLVERLKEARRNAHSIGATLPVQNGGDNTELQQQFQQLQQQVQDLLNRNSSDEKMLSESQLTQVKSLVQATINETIEQTATAAAHAAVNAFTGLRLLQLLSQRETRRVRATFLLRSRKP